MSGLLQTHHVAEDALEFLTLQLPSSKCCNNRCWLIRLACVVLEIQSFVHAKQSFYQLSYNPSPRLGFCFTL